jgi:hypothetical protein
MKERAYRSESSRIISEKITIFSKVLFLTSWGIVFKAFWLTNIPQWNAGNWLWGWYIFWSLHISWTWAAAPYWPEGMEWFQWEEIQLCWHFYSYFSIICFFWRWKRKFIWYRFFFLLRLCALLFTCLMFVEINNYRILYWHLVNNNDMNYQRAWCVASPCTIRLYNDINI